MNTKIKKTTGILLMVAGVGFGVYAGLVWAFIGGIIDVIQAVKAVEVEAMAVAIGVAKIVFAGLIGAVSAFALAVPGFTLWTTSK